MRTLWFFGSLGIASELRIVLDPKMGEVRAMTWSAEWRNGGPPDGQQDPIVSEPARSNPEAVCGVGPTSEVVWWPAAGEFVPWRIGQLPRGLLHRSDCRAEGADAAALVDRP